MTTIDPALDLPRSAPQNLRDLGGIPIADGVIRPGFAIRTDDLALASEESARELVAGGLRTVIDLRSHDEAAFTGRGPLAALDVTYHHIPLLVGLDDSAAQPGSLAQPTFGPMYVRMFESAAPRIVAALAVVAHSPGATAFHCAAGQDRTGVLAAALLLALGASPDDIVADYARTGANSAAIVHRLEPVMGALMRRFGFDLDEAARAALRAEFSAEPMRMLLVELERRHGDPLAPLRAAGLSDALVALLRTRALGAVGDAA